MIARAPSLLLPDDTARMAPRRVSSGFNPSRSSSLAVCRTTVSVKPVGLSIESSARSCSFR